MNNQTPILEMTHILLTRFNTAIDYAPSSKGIDGTWLRERISLFEQYCLPSVNSQSNNCFSWLVFCDARSPAWFRTAIAAYGPILKAVYMEGPATDEAIARAVQETGLVQTPYLVTTRLDNDDAIGSDYVALIQKAFQRQERQFLLFPFGLQSFRSHLYNVYWRSNPFLTLVEKVKSDGSFTTVLCVPHDKVRSTGLARDLCRAAMAASAPWREPAELTARLAEAVTKNSGSIPAELASRCTARSSFEPLPRGRSSIVRARAQTGGETQSPDNEAEYSHCKKVRPPANKTAGGQ